MSQYLSKHTDRSSCNIIGHSGYCSRFPSCCTKSLNPPLAWFCVRDAGDKLLSSRQSMSRYNGIGWSIKTLPNDFWVRVVDDKVTRIERWSRGSGLINVRNGCWYNSVIWRHDPYSFTTSKQLYIVREWHRSIAVCCPYDCFLLDFRKPDAYYGKVVALLCKIWTQTSPNWSSFLVFFLFTIIFVSFLKLNIYCSKSNDLVVCLSRIRK